MSLDSENREFAERNVDLALEFNRYVIEHPEITEEIGGNARVIFQIEGDEEFNEWGRELGKSYASRGDKPIVYVTVKKMRPIQSRIEELEVTAH